MKQEDKELLLKDLCARLPYGVKVQTNYINQKTKERSDIGIDTLSTVEISMLIEGYEEHKPYLFPLSSMTEEQQKELKKHTCPDGTGYFKEDRLCCPINHIGEQIPFIFMSKIIEWLDKNHFDYRGLIEMGLAIDATGLDVY